MTNIIGLTAVTTDATYKVMVNADNISYFRSDDEGCTEILMVGGDLLVVREDIYTIVEMIEPAEDFEVSA